MDELVDVVVLVVTVCLARRQGHLVHLEHGHLHVQTIGGLTCDRGATADQGAAGFNDMTDQLK